MQDNPFDLQADVGSPSENPSGRRRSDSQPRQTRTRKRTTTACNTCRARRTKCDSRKPACGYCHAHGVDCEYEQGPSVPRTRIEVELSGINQRLDYVTGLLQTRPCASSFHNQASSTPGLLAPNRTAIYEQWSPFQLLGTRHMMETLGLDPSFLQDLLARERASPPLTTAGSSALRVIQREDAFMALSAFSGYVHIWYPILRPGFSDHYIRTISGPLNPSPNSCLVLMVAAIGVLVQKDDSFGLPSAERNSGIYLEAAMASLPSVLVDTTVVAVQCLLLLSVYHCCLVKPCQAYEYIMMASFKVQNLLKTVEPRDGELCEQVKRAYWAVLLLESELQDQLDAVRSGIWDHDEATTLPDSRSAWLFDIDLASSPIASTSPTSLPSIGDNNNTNKTQAYFLAEIAIRRMLHRCNTAIKTAPDGTVVYAPSIARELQRQLDEWYGFLPDIIRFEDDRLFDFDILTSPGGFPFIEPLSNFLRVQYYCCKLSIYWPAVYQCIQDGATTADTREHAERFFNAYIQLIPTLLTAIRSCIVNRWTLCTTLFVTTMTALQGANTRCLKEECVVQWERLGHCLKSARNVSKDIIGSSTSLTSMDETLAERLGNQ